MVKWPIPLLMGNGTPWNQPPSIGEPSVTEHFGTNADGRSHVAERIERVYRGEPLGWETVRHTRFSPDQLAAYWSSVVRLEGPGEERQESS